MNNDTLSPLGNVITIDDERIKSHLDRVVRGSCPQRGVDFPAHLVNASAAALAPFLLRSFLSDCVNGDYAKQSGARANVVSNFFLTQKDLA
jgi:hypothetical protein